MESIFFLAGIYLCISVVAAIIAYHLDISIALVEICLGVAAAAVADRFFGKGSLGGSQQWLQFLAPAGAVLLTFLAGAELDPAVIRTKLREVSVVGVVGFLAPFAGGTAVAHFILGWTVPSSFLAGIALSTTSMVLSKIFGLFPVISRFRAQRQERWFYTLLMSTGLTFGTISALYGFSHGIISQAQYSALVATVIASGVIPTFIAGRVFLPRHLLPPADQKHVVRIPEGSPSEE